MLIICTTSRPFERLKFTTITTSANRNSCVRVIPIIFPFGSILLKFINLKFRFYSTPTKLYFQLKILAKYFLQEFSITSFGFWYKLLFIGIVVVKEPKTRAGKSTILDFQNFAIDIQPQIHGAISCAKEDSQNTISLISPMYFGKKLWESSLVQLKQAPRSFEETNRSHTEILFTEHHDSFVLDLNSCFTRELVEIETTPFVSNYADMPIKGIRQFLARKMMMTPKLELAIKKERAVFLGYCHNSNNYYHFLVEQFPRLIQWSKHEACGQIPVLCDEDAPWQIQSLIEEMTNIKPLLIRQDRLYLFRTLTVCQDFRHAQLPNALDLTLENTFDSHRIDLVSVRDFLLAFYTKRFDGQNYDYLFLGRPVNGTRRPNNQDYVERILVNQYGFYSPDLHKLTIGKQIELFSSAKVIVGVGGASLTNLMFCKPNTLFVLQSDTFNPSTRFWPDFASLFNLEIRDITKRVDVGVDMPYDMNVEELLEILNEWSVLQPE